MQKLQALSSNLLMDLILLALFVIPAQAADGRHTG